MRRIFKSLVFILSVGLLFSTFATAEQFDEVMKLKDTAEYTVWRINKPNVKQYVTRYQQIRFQPGDWVSIEVGGCAQRGGWGKTWKRYWNPSGSDSDKMYYGIIAIPGLTNGLQPIRQIGCANNDPSHPDRCVKKFTQPYPDNIPYDYRYLSLGYMDNNYSDNGYWGHDDGTENQCKGVGNAFVVISIGHGKLPIDPQKFTGIAPNDFRCNAAWKFKNFSTDDLSWATFHDSFDFAWYDYLNPVTYIMFAAGRNMAESGNCAGMSLLALVGEDAFSVEDLKEYFWDNYPKETMSPPQVQKHINTAHWKQMSTYFVTKWMKTQIVGANAVAQMIRNDLNKGNYGLLSLQHDWGGHIVVPLSVQSTGGSNFQIQVYDPNRPCPSYPDKSTYPPVFVDGNNWRFTMASGNIWTGSYVGIAYIPYEMNDGWRDLTNGLGDLVQIIFGNSTDVIQMTDKKGRRLFTKPNPKSLADVNTSANGLGNDIIRIPRFGWGHPVPRKAGKKFVLKTAPMPSQFIAKANQMRAEYEKDYGSSKQSYLVRNSQLEELEITLANSTKNKPVRVLIHRKDQWHEIKFNVPSPVAAIPPSSTAQKQQQVQVQKAQQQQVQSATAKQSGMINPSLTIHKISDLSKGVTVRERNGVPIKVNFVHGLISKVQKDIKIQRTDGVDVAATPVKVQIGKDNRLQLLMQGKELKTNIKAEIIDSAGKVKQLSALTPVSKMVSSVPVQQKQVPKQSTPVAKSGSSVQVPQQQAVTVGEMNIDRPGMNLRNFDLALPDPKLCQNACQQNTACKAWTYVKPGIQGQLARCWLKSGVPAPRQNNCCVSGVMSSQIKQVTPIPQQRMPIRR
jgi:hypothetical protein